MSFPYKRCLLVGATSGIGAAMADKLIHEGVKVIAAGRRQDRLDAFVQKHGSEKASGVKFDITDKANMDGFVSRIVENFPDLDCVFLNAGTQAQHRLSRPAEVDLEGFHAEFNTNFTSIVDLSLKFLPHLQAKEHPTSLIFTGSNLAIVPAATLPAYSASKAALNAYVCCLRAQNHKSGTKIIEIWPPVVQSELHDYVGKERGRSYGMPADQFANQVYAKLAAGEEEVVIGTVGRPDMEPLFREVAHRRKRLTDELSQLMLSHFEL